MEYDRAENKKLRGMIETLRSEKTALKAELSDLKEELNLVSEQRDILATDCDQSKADLTESKRAHDKTTETLEYRDEDYERAKVKVSELESLVAGLRRIVECMNEPCGLVHPENYECCLREAGFGADIVYNALADTAKTAREHDARVRAEALELSIRILGGCEDLNAKSDKSLSQVLGELQTKATEARTEADATEKGEGA